MARYKNGQIPASLLIRRGHIRLTAGTWAKWDRLVTIVEGRHGVTLEITQGTGVSLGSGGYRDIPMQRAVKKKYIALGRPWQAAAEGTSSHGGEFNGEDALAIDVSNWGLIGQAAFYAAAREAGFVAGYFNGQGGRPKEPWHIIDKDPYRIIHQDQGDDMGTIDNTEENYQTIAGFLQRALRFDVRPNGKGADWKLGPTVWERLNTLQAAAATGTAIDPKAAASAIAEAIPDELAEKVVAAIAKRMEK